ncbi:MAG: virulence protein [Oscillospiraceae bacterium]|nr:virulence protein [Oscillospiraceae bacterium]
MTTKMNLNGTTRKALVAAIAEITGDQPIYRKVPTCNYDIGDITITKDGSIICPDDSDILAALVEAGFTAENDDAAEHTENTGLTVSLPSDGFTDSAIDNLRKLVDAKASLMRKALGADRLDIEVTDDRVSFPWWDTLPEPEDTRVYTGFIAALCNMSKDAKRVLAKETEVESEKYAFRCFLLRLGYVGNDSKAARKILLRNLSGHSAFRNKAEEEKFKANQKAKRDAAKAAKQTTETGEGVTTDD